MILFPPLYQTSSGTPRDLPTLLGLKSQGFGDNVAYYQALLGTNGHSGIDWPCNTGTKVYASHDGTVQSVSTDVQKGEGVVLRGSDGITLYWHMEQPLVSVGQAVKRGDVIGLSDNTGYSTGAHLHLEYRRDSEPTTNGHFGAVDPTPFLVWDTPPQTTENMSESEVKDLYKLAFYRLPAADELAFWVGKSLQVFLDTAIADRAKFLATPL